MRHTDIYWADRFHPGQRLADDAAEEGRCCAIGPARAHRHCHQACSATIDEALARVVGNQVLADQLLYAVGSLGRGQRVVGNSGGHGHIGVRTEHRYGTGKHQACHFGAGAQHVEQGARAVQIGAHTKLEISLAFSRHRRGEVKHAVKAIVAQSLKLS